MRRLLPALSILLLAVSASAAPINIPLKTWIRLAPPSEPGEQKHVTWAYNPNDGRLYSVGGDFSSYGPTPDPGRDTQSYNQTMYSLSIAERFADRNNASAGWRREMRYCEPNWSGGVTTKGLDFGGWSWDARRNVFWLIPGLYDTPKSSALCPGETQSKSDDANYLSENIMTYNPAAAPGSRFTSITSSLPPHDTPPEQWWGFYDYMNDELIRLSRNTQGGAVVTHISVPALLANPNASWTTVNVGNAADGSTIYWEKEGAAFDSNGRFIYSGDCSRGSPGRFFKYNVDTRTKSNLGALPGSCSGTADNDRLFAFDTVNNLVYYWNDSTGPLHVWPVATQGPWTAAPMTLETPGSSPSVRHAMVYDPGQNVLVFLGGGGGSGSGFDLFLYRWSNGGPIDALAPAFPTGLSVK